MVNYANSKVYKIWSTQGDKIYVGSTTKQYLSQRMDKHRSDYKHWKNGHYGHTTSFQLFDEYGLENCFIELIEAKEFKSKDELHKLEGKKIRELNCVNKIIAGRTHKEYRTDNRVKISEHMKTYYSQTKEQKLEYQKEYFENNKQKVLERQGQKCICECGISYTHGHKLRHLKSIKHCQNLESQNKLIQ